MNDFVKKLYTELIEELSVYADLGTLPVRKVTGALVSISEAVSKLKAFVAEAPFESADQEIEFFKYDKPAFIAEQYYAMEIFTIEAARPLNDAQLLKGFYEQELKYVRRFLEQNKFLYAYFQADMKELDHLLFVRGAKPVDIPVPDIIGLDAKFNTCGDNLFAKFIAFDRLEDYLLDHLFSPPGAKVVKPGEKTAPLPFKILCKLSVDQLAIFLRACDDNRVIEAKSLSSIFRAVAPYLSTENKEDISWAGMRKSSYQFERSDVEVVVATLGKLMGTIRAYH